MIRHLSTLLPGHQVARIAVLLLAVFAFGAQQWAVQVHWHSSAGVLAGLEASAPDSDRDAPAGGSGRTHPECLWCQIASHAGAVAPPAVWSGVPENIGHAFLRPAAGQPAAFVPPPSWAWYSRGPPAA
jgi:hypothetical protein